MRLIYLDTKQILAAKRQVSTDSTAATRPISPLMLFKALLLESWQGLSDVAVVEEIHDRRGFGRLIGEGCANTISTTRRW